jgi:hypothetical protein
MYAMWSYALPFSSKSGLPIKLFALCRSTPDGTISYSTWLSKTTAKSHDGVRLFFHS